MKNVQHCPNCNAENPIYKYSCVECKAFLRTRVVNIDLWHTISALIESPVKTFKSIIEAEHKNFVLFINSLIGIKLFLLAVIFQSFIEINSVKSDFFFLNLLILVAFSYLLFAALSYTLTKINSSFGLTNRFRDNYSIYVYAFFPLLMSLVILSPVHYALFGPYWFTYNPPPYVVKPMEAYVLLFIEGLLTVWSIVLLGIGIFAQTRNKLFAVLAAVISFAIIIAVLFFFPFLPL